MSTIARLVTELTLDDQLSSQLGKTQKQIQGIGKSLDRVGKKLTTRVSLPILALGAFAVKTFADFEQAMANVNSVADLTEQQFADLTKLARQLGRDTVFSATEAANAIGELVKAGVSVKDVFEGAAKAAVDLAAATGVSVPDAATIMSNAMNIFGIAGSDAATVADTFAAAANKSAAAVPDLALGMAQAGNVAAQFGLDLQDTVGALALFSDFGLRGSDAGTSMRTMLLSLLDPTKKQTKMMNNLGLTFFDAQGNFVGLEEMAGRLQSQLGHLTEEERNTALAVLFGSDAVRAANVLYKAGADGVAEYVGEVGKTGAAAEMAAKRQKTLMGALERLKGAIDDAAISFGEVMAPMILRVARFLERFAEALARLPTPVRIAMFFLAGLLAVIGPLLIVVGAIASGVAGLIPVFAAIGPSILALLGPIGLLIAGLALLGLAWQFNLFGLRDRIQEHVEDFRRVFDRLRGEGVDPISAAIRAFGSALEDLTGVEMSDFFLRLAFFTQLGIAVIRQGIDDLGLAMDLASAIFGQFQRDVEFAFDLLRPVVIEGARAIDLFVRDVVLGFDLAGDVIGHWAANVRLAFAMAGAVFREGIDAVRQVVRDVQGIGRALGAIDTSMFIAAGVAMARGLITGWVQEAALFAFILNNLGLWAFGQVADVTAALVRKGADLVTGLKNGWVHEAALFAVILNNLGLWAFGHVGDVTTALLRKGADLVTGLKNGWAATIWQVAFVLNNLGSWAAGQVGNLGGVLFGAGTSLVSGLTAGILSSIPGLVSAVNQVNGIINGIIDFVDPGSPSRLTTPVGESIPWGLAVGIQRKMGMLHGAIGSVNAAIGMSSGAPLPSMGLARSSAMPGMGASQGGGMQIFGTVNVNANDPTDFWAAMQQQRITGAR